MNLAEWATQTFKNHLKAVIAGVVKTFLMGQWDRLLPQTVLTLILLQQSNVTPIVSAYQYINGAFDYNKMPLAPMGCAVQIDEHSERRGSWAANIVDGWYLQTSPKHYQCYIVYVKSTRSERVSDIVHFKHKYITQSTSTPQDMIVKALNGLTKALKKRKNKKDTEQIEALQKIDELLNKVSMKTTSAQSKATSDNRQVILDEMSKTPQETQPAPRVTNDRPSPKVIKPCTSITKATIDNPLHGKTQPPSINKISPANIKL
jgi:hypothetical protein